VTDTHTHTHTKDALNCTFDQFNVSLVNKNINFLKKKKKS